MEEIIVKINKDSLVDDSNRTVKIGDDLFFRIKNKFYAGKLISISGDEATFRNNRKEFTIKPLEITSIISGVFSALGTEGI